MKSRSRKLDKQFIYSRKKDKAIPFFSASSVSDVKILYDFGIKEILVSYFYIRKAPRFYEEFVPKFYKEGGIFMTDSGAFSFMGSARTDEMEKPDYWDSYRKEYIDWCVAHKDYIFSMVNLDLDRLIGRDKVFEWNKKYFEPLEKMGLQVIYVAHEDDNFDKDATIEFTYYCKKYRYVGINQVNKKFAAKYYNIANHYKARIHGFAWTELPILKRFPFFSVDSSVAKDSMIWVRHNGIIEHISIVEFFDRKFPCNTYGVEDRKLTQGYETITLCSDNKIRWKELRSVVRHRVRKPMYKIRLEGNIYLTVTSDHSLIKLDKDGNHVSVKADELQEGQCILVCSHFPKFKNRGRRLPLSLLLFMGLWIGDGYRDKYGIHLSGCHNFEVRAIADNVARMFGSKLTVAPNGEDVSISNGKLRDIFNRYGLKDMKSYTKRIPKEILSLDRESLEAVLCGYFSADGTVTNRSVEFSTVSKGLAEDVSSLLHSYGIHTSTDIQKESTYLIRGKKGKKKKLWHVTINDYESRAIFLQNIDFCTSEKHNHLFMSLLESRGKKQLWAKRSGVDVSLSLTNKIKMGNHTYQCKGLKPTQVRVRRCGNTENFNRNVLNNDVWYYKIISITEVPSLDDVYDLEVPSTQNFIANDVIVHNTSWLTGMRFGTTFIDDGKNFRSLDSKHKFLRKTHRLKYEAEGLSMEDINADKRLAIQNMNLIGWRAFVREYIKVANIKLNNREVSYYERR